MFGQRPPVTLVLTAERLLRVLSKGWTASSERMSSKIYDSAEEQRRKHRAASLGKSFLCGESVALLKRGVCWRGECLSAASKPLWTGRWPAGTDEEITLRSGQDRKDAAWTEALGEIQQGHSE